MVGRTIDQRKSFNIMLKSIMLKSKTPDGMFCTSDEVKCVQLVSETVWVHNHGKRPGCREDLASRYHRGQEAYCDLTSTMQSRIHQYLRRTARARQPASKLSQCGKILSQCRGYWQSHPEWENGIRHFRMELDQPIPSYIKVGPFQLDIKYTRQEQTCRSCGETGHIARSCPNQRCYNCQELGHQGNECSQPLTCRICSREGHLGRECPDSYRILQGKQRWATHNQRKESQASTTTQQAKQPRNRNQPRYYKKQREETPPIQWNNNRRREHAHCCTHSVNPTPENPGHPRQRTQQPPTSKIPLVQTRIECMADWASHKPEDNDMTATQVGPGDQPCQEPPQRDTCHQSHRSPTKTQRRTRKQWQERKSVRRRKEKNTELNEQWPVSFP